MRKAFVIFAFLALFIGFPGDARAQLPPDVQADLLKTKLTAAMRQQNYANVLSVIDEMRALKLPLPGSIDYFEAFAAAETEDWVRAHDRVTNFLKNDGKSHKLYSRALELYARIEPHVETARKAMEEESSAERETALEELNARVDALLEENDFAAAYKAIDQAVAGRKLTGAPKVLAKINAARQEFSAAQQQQMGREKIFAKRMNAASDFFAKELAHVFRASFAWTVRRRGDRPRESDSGNVKAMYDQSVAWGGRDAPCGVSVRNNHRLVYRETSETYAYDGSPNGYDEIGTYAVEGSGIFVVGESDAELKWDSEKLPDVARMGSLLSETKNIFSGSAPRNVFTVTLDVSNDTGPSTYRQKRRRKSEARFFQDNSVDTISRTREDEYAVILGSPAQMGRFRLALDHLFATCKCLTRDTYDAFGQTDKPCSSVPMTPPVLAGPKPVYTPPQRRPAATTAPDQPEEFQE